jgi:hypothetical protein
MPDRPHQFLKVIDSSSRVTALAHTSGDAKSLQL